MNKLSYLFVKQLLSLPPVTSSSEEEPARHSNAKFVHPLEEYKNVIELVTRKRKQS